MDTQTEFDELGGIRPGCTTVREVLDAFGEADEASPRSELGLTSGPGFYLRFNAAGIDVFFTGALDAMNAVIDEVRMVRDNTASLQCGLYLGMPRQEATELIHRLFPVTEEYDDAIYFVPSKTRQVAACAEFMAGNSVTTLALDVDHTT